MILSLKSHSVWSTPGGFDKGRLPPSIKPPNRRLCRRQAGSHLSLAQYHRQPHNFSVRHGNNADKKIKVKDFVFTRRLFLIIIANWQIDLIWRDFDAYLRYVTYHALNHVCMDAETRGSNLAPKIFKRLKIKLNLEKKTFIIWPIGWCKTATFCRPTKPVWKNNYDKSK